MPRPRKGGDICAIFVHAGAGFHSQTNEKAHLDVCENASKVAMSMLKNGGSAVDAVEIAIMLLEDAEITNAGYGSNLTINGTVECDATVVDHKGRSGAVGAVAHVKNPISLARVVLESSTKPLSLQRVPPNFLVGSGATDFAYEHGLIVLPEDGLISDGARERWHRWQRDLEIVEASERQQHPAKYHNDKANSFIRGRGYNAAQLAAIANGARTGGPGEFSNDACHPNPNNHLLQLGGADGVGSLDGQPLQAESSPVHASARSNSAVNVGTNHPGPIAESEGTCNTRPTTSGDDGTTDNISDTVGAIAVDCHGNIAAGSSSGGIGMKHRGRIGPAALVGIGTAVVPVDPNDPERTCVASVTSGTGEHIATTLAASTCASRVYYNERKTADGAFEEVTEDEAMRAMIDAEFMGHPGVRTSHCLGAIGILTVKKTTHGIHLYFGHNTDSFALASMSSEDKRPSCVMSRSTGNGSIAQGGRSCRYKK